MKLMKFTKKQRHEIYKKTLELYTTCDTDYHPGLCYCLSVIIKILYIHPEWQRGALLPTNHIFLLPEFMEIGRKLWPHSSADKIFNCYWWGIRDTESRIKALNEMIEKTKPGRRIK